MDFLFLCATVSLSKIYQEGRPLINFLGSPKEPVNPLDVFCQEEPFNEGKLAFRIGDIGPVVGFLISFDP